MNKEEKLEKELEIVYRYFDLESLDHDTCDEFQLELHKAKVCGECPYCEEE